jgi:hypothetical protein
LDSKPEDKIFCTEWQQAFPDFNLFLISYWIEFWPLSLFQIFEPFQPFKVTILSFYNFDFVLRSDLQTWPCI